MSKNATKNATNTSNGANKTSTTVSMASNNSNTLRQTQITCPGHTRPVVFLDFSAITASGYYLISACKDGKPMLRQGETGDWIGTFEGHKGAVWGVALNSGATLAATAAADFQSIIWDALSGTEKHSFSHKHIVKTVDFSSDDSLLLTGSNEKLLRIFDLNNSSSDPKVLSGHTGGLKQALFTNDNKNVVSIGDDRTLRYWDVNNGVQIKKVDLPSNATSIEVSENGQILTISYANKVSFWDASKFDQIKEFPIPTEVFSASLHKNQKEFVCGGLDFKVYKFNYETGKEMESYKGHFGPVHCIRYSPDCELYASGSEDGTLRLWQTTVGKTYGLWKWNGKDKE